MDRRSFLSLATTKSHEQDIKELRNISPLGEPSPYGLEEYEGEWTSAHALHLLSRTTFGPLKAELDECLQLGVSASVDKLFQFSPLDDVPLSYNRNDAASPYGETFVDKQRSAGMEGQRAEAFLGWWGARLMKARFDISEKLTLFWSNHYSTELSIINDTRYSFKLYELLRNNAAGNFRQLTKDVTINPAMLVYLNGDRNIAQSPNENYARELFELFTVGKGPQIEPGNYTNYTESDIQEAAKVLTGWTFRNRIGNTEPQFFSLLHDKSTKQFSSAFGGRSISNLEENEYKALVDLIFMDKKPALYLARKLYIWFVNDYIDEDVEQKIITPLANIIFDDDYNVKEVIKILLKSAHFNDSLMHGSSIKMPLDFLADIYNKLGFQLADGDFETEYRNHLSFLVYYAAVMEQTLNNPPSVAGWPAFYQLPQLKRMWLNSVTLPIRRRVTDGVIYVGLVRRQQGRAIKIDPLSLLDAVDEPVDEYNIIDYYVNLFFPVEITDAKRNDLRKAFVPEGQPDYFWAYAYAMYVEDPQDEQIANGLRFVLIQFFSKLMASAEFQLN